MVQEGVKEKHVWNKGEIHVKGCFPDGSVGKESASNAEDAGDTGSILKSGRSPGGGNGNPLQYSCLKNLIDRGIWRATAHEVTKSQT